MTKQENTARNMAKFIQAQTLLLLEKLNELIWPTSVSDCTSCQNSFMMV